MDSHAGVLPVVHSILATTTLAAEIAPDYEIGQPVECRFLNQGLNDTYLVKTVDDSYILRVYRLNWRSLSDILYEVDLLTHLGRRRAPVSVPIARRDGRFSRIMRMPEGNRHAVLFTYARGDPPAWPPDEAYCRLYGSAAAEIHSGLDDFSSDHERFPIDLDYLLDRPLQAILPFLQNRLDDAEYVRGLADRLKERVTLLDGALQQGVCHGDFHGGNCHVSDDKALTFFDFDCCGRGWRAFDIATFRWGAKLNGADEKIWSAFLEGYTARRALSEVDREAVPLFVLIRHIWLLGLHTANASDWGAGWLNKRYFDRGLKFLRDWEADQLGSDQRLSTSPS